MRLRPGATIGSLARFEALHLCHEVMNKPLVAGLAVAWSLVAVAGGTAVSVFDSGPGHRAPRAQVDIPLPPPVPVARVQPADVHQVADKIRRGAGKIQHGIASWYGGPEFHVTANGEVFRPDRLAAASRTLPFNTRVRVTNLRNGRSVVVRINDRGPYVRGRVIDLTPEAAKKLDMKHRGLAPVAIQIVSNDTPTVAGTNPTADR